MSTSAHTELVRTAPMFVGAAYLEFVSTYGAAILTSLGIIYTAFNIFLRVNEYLDKRRAIKKLAEEAARAAAVLAEAAQATAAMQEGTNVEAGK